MWSPRMGWGRAKEVWSDTCPMCITSHTHTHTHTHTHIPSGAGVSRTTTSSSDGKGGTSHVHEPCVEAITLWGGGGGRWGHERWGDMRGVHVLPL